MLWKYIAVYDQKYFDGNIEVYDQKYFDGNIVVYKTSYLSNILHKHIFKI